MDIPRPRYTLTLGLPDSASNRIYAEHKAKIIELDLISSNFDLTLKKYESSQCSSINWA